MNKRGCHVGTTSAAKRRNVRPASTEESSSLVSRHKSAVTRFATEMEGATMRTVNPADCVPLIMDREAYRGGVEKMKRIFRGLMVDGSMTGETHVTAGAGAPVVVIMTDMYRPYLAKALRDEGMAEEQVEAKMTEDKVWYGVVDGNFRLWAVLELIEEEPAIWMSFKWSVLVLNNSPPLDRLRQMKRAHEETKKVENSIEITLYDEYKRMLQEYDRLSRGRKKPPSSSIVAQAYDGGVHKCTDTVSQKARTAIRLGPEVVKELGCIMSEEHPTLAARHLSTEHPAKDPENTSKFIDCRVYKRFVNDMCLKQATNFMSREGEQSCEVQVHVLYRLRSYSRDNDFKAANFKYVSEQYKAARLATVEARKFESLIGTESWPDRLENYKTKLLRRQEFDDEVAVNEKKGRAILPSLLKEYKDLYPDDAVRNIEKYNSGLTPADDRVGAEQGNADAQQPSSNDVEENEQGQPEANLDLQQTPEQKRRHTIALLKAVRVEVHNCTWEHYFNSVRNDDDDDFDLVLTDPPFGNPPNPSKSGEQWDDHLRDRDFKVYSEKCFKSLTRGGYVFIITSADYSSTWKSALRQAGFSVWGGLYVLLRSMKGRQLRKKGAFPQVFNEFGVIARRPGNRSDSFKLNMDDPYELIPCKYPRRLAVIDKIPLPKPKLTCPRTKKIVRVAEKNVDLLRELLKTMCPAGGNFFDGFAGTLTGAIAALKTGRKCVVVEKDDVCFNLALDRLRTVYDDIYSQDANVQVEMRRRCQLSVQSCEGNVSAGEEDDDSVQMSEADSDIDENVACQTLQDFDATRGGTEHSRNTTSDSQETTPSIGTTTPTRSVLSGRSTPSSRMGPGEAEKRMKVSDFERLIGLSEDVTVSLLSNSKTAVGTARLATMFVDGTGEKKVERLRRTLHGQDLDKMNDVGDEIIVVRGAIIDNDCKDDPFPGVVVGTDDEISSLRKISQYGFYAWPAGLLLVKDDDE